MRPLCVLRFTGMGETGYADVGGKRVFSPMLVESGLYSGPGERGGFVCTEVLVRLLNDPKRYRLGRVDSENIEVIY